MNLSRSLRRGVVLVALLALAAPLAAVSGNGKGGNDRGNGRVVLAFSPDLRVESRSRRLDS